MNLNAAGNPGEISPRFYTTVPLALGFFYTYWRLHRKLAHALVESERKLRAADIYCWLGTITFAALMRFELEADWVASAWAALAFGLLAIAWNSERRVFLYQGLMVAVGVLFRTVLHNFYERSYFPAPRWESRWITVGTSVALLLAALLFAFQLRKNTEESVETGLVRVLQSIVRRPEQLLFFIAVGLLTVLLATEMRHGMVTLSWGLEGVAVFVLALWLGERSFRLSGLGLLLLCVGKILLVDVWRLDPRDRYLDLYRSGCGSTAGVVPLYTESRGVAPILMKRWIIFAGIVLLSVASAVVSERRKVDVPASPAALLYLIADTEQELTQMPVSFTRMSDAEEIRMGDELCKVLRRSGRPRKHGGSGHCAALHYPRRFGFGHPRASHTALQVPLHPESQLRECLRFAGWACIRGCRLGVAHGQRR